MNRKFLIVILLIFLSLLVGVYSGLNKKSTRELKLPDSYLRPTFAPNVEPPPLPAQGETYQTNETQLEEKIAEDLKKEEQIGKLLNILPYTGNSFQMDYNIDTNRYIVNIYNNKGEEEFDAFLKKNGIEDRTWIQNLQIYK